MRKKISGVFLFAFPLRKRNRNKISRFSVVIISVRMVVFLRWQAQRARRGILMPRGKKCRETMFAAQLPRNYPHREGNFQRRQKSPLLQGRGILRDILGEGNCESKIATRKWGVNFCREASRCLAGPSGRSLGFLQCINNSRTVM